METLTTEEKDALIEKVIERIKKDLEQEDTTAIHSMLTYVPDENLKAFLPESDELFIDILY